MGAIQMMPLQPRLLYPWENEGVQTYLSNAKLGSYYSFRQEFEMEGQFQQWEHIEVLTNWEECQRGEDYWRSPQVLGGFDKDRKMQSQGTIAMSTLREAYLPNLCETHPPKLQNRRR